MAKLKLNGLAIAAPLTDEALTNVMPSVLYDAVIVSNAVIPPVLISKLTTPPADTDGSVAPPPSKAVLMSTGVTLLLTGTT